MYKKSFTVALAGAAMIVLAGCSASNSASSHTVAAASSSSPTAKPVQETVPNVVGQTVAQATGNLGAYRLNADAGSAADTQTVISQSPAAGTQVPAGTTVELTAQPPAGSSASNPAAAGTKEDMQSTNSLSGAQSTYTEWIDSYLDNFSSGNEFEAPSAGDKYVAVTVHVLATSSGVDSGTVADDVSPASTSGTVYQSTTVDAAKQMPSVTLGSGQQASGQVVFEVPNSFHGGILSIGDGTIFLKTS